MTTRNRFRLAHFLIPVAAVALLAASFVWAPQAPSLRKAHGNAIDPKAYGHVQAYDGYWLITLAPNSDLNLRRWELGLGRVMFTTAGLAVSDDGEHFTPLSGEPMSQCGYHWQGAGLNAIATIGKCVPGWASVSGDPANHHAAEWIRLENLSPRARIVLVKYDPLGG